MMINNDDEIRAFDDKVSELRTVLNSASEAKKVAAVGDIMRIMFSHDWPEWAPGHEWCFYPDCFDAFDSDDAEFVKRFTAGATTVLKSDGSRGVAMLQKYAASYLHQRGYDVATLSAELDAKDPWQGWKTSKQYAADLDTSTKSIQRALPGLIKTKQADRKSERGKINLRQSACEILKPQD